jgi:hypothetical protein
VLLKHSCQQTWLGSSIWSRMCLKCKGWFKRNKTGQILGWSKYRYYYYASLTSYTHFLGSYTHLLGSAIFALDGGYFYTCWIPVCPLLKFGIDLCLPPPIQLVAHHKDNRYPHDDTGHLSRCLFILWRQLCVWHWLDDSSGVSWSSRRPSGRGVGECNARFGMF